MVLAVETKSEAGEEKADGFDFRRTEWTPRVPGFCKGDMWVMVEPIRC